MYAPKEDMKNVVYAVDMLPRILDIMGNNTGIEYSMPKLGVYLNVITYIPLPSAAQGVICMKSFVKKQINKHNCIVRIFKRGTLYCFNW